MNLARLRLVMLATVWATLSSASAAFAHDLKVTDSKGNVFDVKDAGIDYTPSYRSFLTDDDRESEGIRAYQGQGRVLLRWAEVETVTILSKDDSVVPYRLRAEVLLANGRKLPLDLVMDGQRGLYGKTDVGEFSIDLENVRSIAPMRTSGASARLAAGASATPSTAARTSASVERLPDVAAVSRDIIDWIKASNKFGPEHAMVEKAIEFIGDDLSEANHVWFSFGSGLMRTGRAQLLHVWAGQIVSFALSDDQAARSQVVSSSMNYQRGAGRREPRAVPARITLGSATIRNARQLDPNGPLEGDVDVVIGSDVTEPLVLRLGYWAAGTTTTKYFYPERDLRPGSTTLHFSFDQLGMRGEEFKARSQPLVLFLDVCAMRREGQEADLILSNTAAVLVDVR